MFRDAAIIVDVANVSQLHVYINNYICISLTVKNSVLITDNNQLFDSFVISDDKELS